MKYQRCYVEWDCEIHTILGSDTTCIIKLWWKCRKVARLLNGINYLLLVQLHTSNVQSVCIYAK
jgi:hypothetical protein